MSVESKTNNVELDLNAIFSTNTSSTPSTTQNESNYSLQKNNTQISPFDPSLSTGYKYQDPSKFLTPTGHKLPHAYKFWIFKRETPISFTTQDDYLKSLISVGPFDTVEEFWKIYSYIRRPTTPRHHVIHCFRADLSPTWECDGNMNGGAWKLTRLRGGVPHRLFEAALLAMIGDEFNLGDDLCGIVLTLKRHGETLSFWNSDGSDPAKVERLSQAIRTLIGPIPCTQRYDLHQEKVKKKTKPLLTQVPSKLKNPRDDQDGDDGELTERRENDDDTQ